MSKEDNDIIHVGENSIARARSEDGKFYVHTTFYDDKSLDRNAQLRNNRAIEKMKLSLHEGEDVRGIVSCPSVEQWNLFKKQYPSTYALLKSSHEFERIRGLKEVSLIYPAWIVQLRL